MTGAAERLSAVGAMRTRRDGAQVVYALYVGALVTVLLGAPVVRALVLGLARPPAVDLLRSPGSSLVVATACGTALAVALAAGSVRGPVLVTPVRALLAATDLPRRCTLRGALLAPVALLVAAAAAAAALLAGVLVAAGSATPAGGTAFVAASAAFAVVSGVVWLAGQVLAGDHPEVLALLAGALLAATALTVAVPSSSVLVPWGWVGAAWPGAGAPPWWPVVALLVTTAAAAACAPALLERLHLGTVLEQSRRWQAARTAASVADVATALAAFRTGPRRGRRRRAVVAAPAPVRYPVRDAVGASRTPARAVVASAALVASGALVGLAAALADRSGMAATGGGPAAGGPSAWALAAVGAVVGFAALGVLGDGFRQAAAGAGAPRLDGHGTARLYALHATLPLAWGSACAGAGASAAAHAAAPGAPVVTAVVTAVLVTAVLVAARAHDSARGPLPLALLMPVPSPGGDLSGLGVALWQVDAVVLSVVAAVLVVTAATTSGPVAGAVASVVVATVLVATTVRRIRRA